MTPFLIAVGAFVLVCVYAWTKEVRHYRLLRVAREGLGFQDFVDSFPEGSDRELLSQVYQFFSELPPGSSFPVRADDSIREVFRTEDEDVPDEVMALAEKCGRRSVSPSEAASVDTIREVVGLMELAPPAEHDHLERGDSRAKTG